MSSVGVQWREEKAFLKELEKACERPTEGRLSRVVALALQSANEQYKLVTHFIHRQFQKAPEAKEQGNVLFVVSEILRSAKKQRGNGALKYVDRLEPIVHKILAALAGSEMQEKANRILGLWSKEQVYNLDVLEAMSESLGVPFKPIKKQHTKVTGSPAHAGDTAGGSGHGPSSGPSIPGAHGASGQLRTQLEPTDAYDPFSDGTQQAVTSSLPLPPPPPLPPYMQAQLQQAQMHEAQMLQGHNGLSATGQYPWSSAAHVPGPRPPARHPPGSFSSVIPGPRPPAEAAPWHTSQNLGASNQPPTQQAGQEQWTPSRPGGSSQPKGDLALDDIDDEGGSPADKEAQQRRLLLWQQRKAQLAIVGAGTAAGGAVGAARRRKKSRWGPDVETDAAETCSHAPQVGIPSAPEAAPPANGEFKATTEGEASLPPPPPPPPTVDNALSTEPTKEKGTSDQLNPDSLRHDLEELEPDWEL